MRDIAAFIKSHDDFLKDINDFLKKEEEWLDKLNKEDGTYERELEREKENKIKSWIKQGMVDPYNDNCETIYNRFGKTNHCDICNIQLFPYTRQCMEHNHTTGLFRGFVCPSCNIRIGYAERPCTNNTGIPYLYYKADDKLFVYHKMYRYKPRINKTFKKVEDAIAFAVINQIINEIEDDTILKIQEWVKK